MSKFPYKRNDFTRYPFLCPRLVACARYDIVHVHSCDILPTIANSASPIANDV